MFIKVNNNGQDYILNTNNILSLNPLGEFWTLTFINGSTMRIDKSEAAVIVPLLPTVNNTPLSI